MPGPVMRFRSGNVSATVYEKVRKDGTLFPEVKLSKLIRDERSQEWAETSTFAVNDLPVVAILARKAFEALALDHAANSLPYPTEEQEIEKPVRKAPRRGEEPR